MSDFYQKINDEFNSEFFQVTVRFSCQLSNFFIVFGVVTRKDNQEDIPNSPSGKGKTREEALLNLYKNLKEFFDKLTVPPDWKEESRVLVKKCVDFREKSTCIVLYNTIQPDELSSDLNKAIDFYYEVRNCLVDSSIELIHGVLGLSESEKIRMMTASKHIYSHELDAWGLDEVTARRTLFDYVINPSPAVIEAHQRHVRCLDSKYCDDSESENSEDVE